MKTGVPPKHIPAAQPLPRNTFGWSEWSGAVGDLGISLPIITALALTNGFQAGYLFALWGVAYIICAWWYRIPMSIQPLKAMAVLALVHEYEPTLLAAVAVLYGLLFVFLARSGLISRLQRVMKPAMIRGVQLGIGLMLGIKAWELSTAHGWTLYSGANPWSSYGPNFWPNFWPSDWWLTAGILLAVVLLLWVLQFRRGWHIAPLLLGGALLVGLLQGADMPATQWRPSPFGGPPGLLDLILSDMSTRWLDTLRYLLSEPWVFWEAAGVLIIAQLPLTLGNAVYAADETARDLWPERMQRVSPAALAGSIGYANIGIGLLGGFPVCHGAGGLAAHAQFGARTGGATIILGALFIGVALIDPLLAALLSIPVVLLAALLLFDAARMLGFVRRLDSPFEIAVAVLIGLLSVLTKNLMLAMLVGALLLFVHSKFAARS